MAIFEERVLPSAWAFLLAPGAGAMSFVAFLPVRLGVAVGVAVAVTACVAGILLWRSPVVRVDDHAFVAGRARLEREFIAGAQPLEGEALREALGPGLDARAHLVYRSWVSSAVRVLLRDAHDPTPYWIVSTRHPDALVEALTSQAAHSEQTG